MSAREDVRFETVAADAALPALRPAWREWSQRVSPFGTPAFLDAWHRAFGGEKHAFVVVGWRGREPALVLPFFHAAGAPRSWFSLGMFRADYSEMCTCQDDPRLGRALWRWLESAAPCDTSKIARMPVDSLLARTVPEASFERRGRALRAVAGLVRHRTLRQIASGRHHEHPYADQALLGELSTRLHEKNVKRKVNLLARTAGEIAYSVVRGPREIAALLPQFFAMHVSNFHATGRASQFESSNDRVFYEALVEHPELTPLIAMDVLSVGGRPAAMHLGFRQGGVVYYYKPAFDMELAKASPGRILLSFMFERAHHEGFHRFEFLKGNEGYKSEWTNRTAETITTTISTRRFVETARRAARQWLR